jgi:Uma2 family endonuclease
VFTQPENGRYQCQKILTEGRISPVMFPQVSLAVNQFIRR